MQRFNEMGEALNVRNQLGPSERDWVAELRRMCGDVLTGVGDFDRLIELMSYDIEQVQRYRFNLDAAAESGRIAIGIVKQHPQRRWVTAAEHEWLAQVTSCCSSTLDDRLDFLDLIGKVAHDIGRINEFDGLDGALAAGCSPKA